MERVQIFLIEMLLNLVAVTPDKYLNMIGRALGLFWFYVVRYRRKLVIQNLKEAFKNEKSEEEILEIAKNNFIFYASSFFEFLKVPILSNEEIKRKINIKNVDHLNKALKKGKGVIILTGHFGNWDMLGVGQAIMGFGAYIITRQAKNKSVNDYWMKVREDKGIKFLADRHSIFAIREKLKENKIVVMVFDQHMPGSLGVKVNFFGRQASTMKAAALLAMKMGTAIVPVNNYKENGISNIEIHPEIPFELKETEEEAITFNTQKYNDKLEEFVRAHPSQWLWIHRRWK